MNRNLFFIALIFCSATLGDSGVALGTGKALYFPCQSCHGEQGLGSEAIHAPALAGQNAEYLSRQLKNYRNGRRGDHSEDTYGRQMVLMAANLNEDKQVELLATYISELPAWKNISLPNAGPQNGGKQYDSCVSCHGKNGGGNPALSAPKIGGLNSLYVATQLRHFRDGVRAYSAQDTAGQQMRAVMSTLKTNQDITAVSAYISGLSGTPE